MKIILSPTKTQKKNFNEVLTKTTPLFYNKSKEIDFELKKYDIFKLKQIFKISDKLSKEVFDTIHNNYKNIAIDLYDGAVFKEIKYLDYNQSQIKFLNENIRILSAKFGVLKPFDEIDSYRLDYLTKIEINLYDFWKNDLYEYFKDELIINLASKEFSKSIKHKMINISFKEKVNDKFKVKSTYAKIARGKMINLIIKNQINQIDSIKEIEFDNYKLNKNISDDYNLIFTR